jgi:hypothetical protein
MIEFLLTPHGLSNLVVVAIIGILQFFYYYNNKRSRKIFLWIFPKNVIAETYIKKDENNVEGLETTHKNQIWNIIIDSINKYLSNNKGSVSDFHLIKDIVDRNCDAQEEEINTLIPVPLYLGLAGTMAGILIGVSFLVFSGSLNSLLSNEAGSNADGIEALLGGVALAMISSIIGIILTTQGTLRVQSEKINVERSKNDFLSWMQAELLPELSNDTANVLQKMTQDLSDFNRTFAINNTQFTTSLSKVAETSDKQAELINLISQLQDKKITVKNLELLNVLEKWITNLHNIKDYNDVLLNHSLEISNYFKIEREQIEQRKTLLAETINKTDSNSKAALEAFNNNFNSLLQRTQETIESKISEIDDTLKTQQEILKTALVSQNEILIKSIEDQKKVLLEKLQGTTKFVEELNKIGDKIASITRLELAIKENNGKLSELIRGINELAREKTTGEFNVIAKSPKLPIWQKLGIYVGASLCIIYFLFEIASKILSLFDIAL